MAAHVPAIGFTIINNFFKKKNSEKLKNKISRFCNILLRNESRLKVLNSRGHTRILKCNENCLF